MYAPKPGSRTTSGAKVRLNIPRRHSMSDGNVRGRLVWHELLTTDTKAAAAFYKQVAGWATKGWPPDPSSYTLFVTKNVPRAGLMILPQEAKAMGAPPNWMSYVG